MTLSFRETIEWSLVSLCTNITEKENFAFFYDANSNKFDLDNWCDNETKTNWVQIL